MPSDVFPDAKSAKDVSVVVPFPVRGDGVEATDGWAVARRLHDISTRLIQEGDIDALYNQILEAAVELMHSDMATMQMLDPAKRQLELLASIGLDASSKAAFAWVPAGAGTGCAAALDAGRRVIVPDVDDCSFIAGTPSHGAHRKADIRAMQATPLVNRSGVTIGMISTHWRKPHQPSDSELLVLDVLARQAADLVERTRNEMALRRSEHELRDFLENASVGIHWVGPDGVIIWANQAELDLLGYSKEEYVGRHIAEFHVDAPVIGDILRRLTGRETLIEHEARLRAKDGSIKNVLINSNVLWDGDKFIHTRCFTRDVTERTKSRQQLTTLAKEVEHRAKNILATVQAVVSLSDGDTPAALKEAVIGRIHALANIHSLFIDTHWTNADLRAFVTHELSPYGETKFKIEGPSLLLAPDVAQAVAMTIHEFATNAAKYGALSTQGGRVAVTWSRDKDQAVLRWVETGGPTVSAPTRRGFGTRVVGSMIEQIKGRLDVEWRPEGLCCEMSIPVLPSPSHA
jgi:PAS domain S-box-containing protein